MEESNDIVKHNRGGPQDGRKDAAWNGKWTKRAGMIHKAAPASVMVVDRGAWTEYRCIQLSRYDRGTNIRSSPRWGIPKVVCPGVMSNRLCEGPSDLISNRLERG